MVVSGFRATRLLIADLRRPTLRSMTAVVLFAALPGICSAGDAPVLPPLEIPVLTDAGAIQLDGDLTDWRQVIGPPLLTERDVWADPTESPCCAFCPSTFWISIWIAVLPPDRVLVAFERGDDVISDGMVDVWRDGQFEFMIEVAPQDIASDAATAQRVEVLPFAEDGLSIRYTGAVGAWRNTAEFIHGVAALDPDEKVTRVELSLTVFDVVSDAGPGESVRSDLRIGDAITLAVNAADNNGNGRSSCYSVINYPPAGARRLQEDASGFAPAVLVGLEPRDTRATPAGWGQIKHPLSR